MDKFTAADLVAFYQKVADGGEVQMYSETGAVWFTTKELSPHLGGCRSEWRVRPTKKVIALSVLIQSGIDCEFKDLDNDSWVVGKLTSLSTNAAGCFRYYKQQDTSGCWYAKSRPRMKHTHAWRGGPCPVPEGFKVKLHIRGGDAQYHTIQRGEKSPVGVYWTCPAGAGSIESFEVIGVADGYVLPWDSGTEKDNG